MKWWHRNRVACSDKHNWSRWRIYDYAWQIRKCRDCGWRETEIIP